MELDTEQLQLFLAETGEQVACINLIGVESPPQMNQLCKFQIDSGFRMLWKQWHEGTGLMTRDQAMQDVSVRVVAFPANRDGDGFLQIDSVLPTRQPPSAEVKPAKTKARVKKRTSFGQRLKKLIANIM